MSMKLLVQLIIFRLHISFDYIKMLNIKIACFFNVKPTYKYK